MLSYLSWQNSPIAISCKCIKNTQGHLICVTCMKNIIPWQVPIGKWKEVLLKETVANSKQCTRKVIVPLTPMAHAPLRHWILPLAHPHPEDPLDKQPVIALGSSCQCKLAFFLFFWAKLFPQSSQCLPEWKLHSKLHRTCAVLFKLTEQKSQIPKVWSDWLVSHPGWLLLHGLQELSGLILMILS